MWKHCDFLFSVLKQKMEPTSFLLTDGSTSKERKILESNIINKKVLENYNKRLLHNMTIRLLFIDAYNSINVILDAITTSNYQSFIDHLKDPNKDIVRGLGVLCSIIGIFGTVILETL